MVGLSELGASEAVLSPAVSLPDFCRAVLAVMPGAAVAFDAELRVWFAEGTALMRAGAGPMVGRLLPDLMRAESWHALKEPYEAAIVGRSTSFTLAADGVTFSIHVSPVVLPGDVPGGLAISHALSAPPPGETASAETGETASAETGGTAEASEEQMLRSAFDLAPRGISVVDLDGRWLRMNDAYSRMLGYEPGELIGTLFRDVTHPDDVAQDGAFVAAAIAGSLANSDREKRYVRKDGSILWSQVRAELIRNQAGEPLYFVSHLQDITERRTAQDQRRESDRTLRSFIDHTPAIICVKGLDHRYQLVNREFEEWCGMRSAAIVGHTAEEMPWSSLIAGTRAMEDAVLEVGETTQEEEVLPRDGQERIYLTTRFPLRNDNGDVHAVCTASTDITERRLEERSKRERLQCAELIYSALAQDRLVLYGQPIVKLATMQPVRFELLIRMAKVRGGTELLAPGQFLPAAERFDLIQVIDEWVVDRGIEHAAAGHRITVNVSAKTISDPQQVDRIEQAVLASDAPAQNLMFEITETAVADNLDAARTFALRMRQHGCAIALDDFGVGHGTFTYLRHLPVDYLKIDLQFVRDLLRDEEDRQVVQAIVGVARQFKIETIAEGVEDQTTLEELRRMGVDYAQGYLIGRPAPLPKLFAPTHKRRRGDANAA